jgi:hypothetical protein
MACPGSVGAFGMHCDPHGNLRQALWLRPLLGRAFLYISVNFSPAVARGFFSIAPLRLRGPNPSDDVRYPCRPGAALCGAGAPIQKTPPILLAREPTFLRLLGTTYVYSLNIGLLYETTHNPPT